MGAILVDNLEIPSMNVINDAMQSGERALMLAEFKLSLNSYLSELATSPVRSLSDIIEFNKKHPIEVNIGHTKDLIFIHKYHVHLISYEFSLNKTYNYCIIGHRKGWLNLDKITFYNLKQPMALVQLRSMLF
jgi:hypothetical protein